MHDRATLAMCPWMAERSHAATGIQGQLGKTHSSGFNDVHKIAQALLPISHIPPPLQAPQVLHRSQCQECEQSRATHHGIYHPDAGGLHKQRAGLGINPECWQVAYPVLHLLVEAHVLVPHNEEHQIPLPVKSVQACAQQSLLVPQLSGAVLCSC